MFRIFIIGKLEAITEALYKTLESQYQVQLCHAEEPMNIIKSLAKITKPDMVILNTLESGDINENLFGFFIKVFHFKRYLSTSSFLEAMRRNHVLHPSIKTI